MDRLDSLSKQLAVINLPTYKGQLFRAVVIQKTLNYPLMQLFPGWVLINGTTE